MRSNLALAAFAALGIATGAFGREAGRDQPRRTFESSGMPGTTETNAEGDFLVTLWDDHAQFRLPAQPAGIAPFKEILRRSMSTGRSMKILFDAAGGRVDPRTGRFDYPLCRATIADLSFEPATPCSQTAAGTAPGANPLALAYAYSLSGDHRRALALLERSGPPDDPRMRKLFLRVHADSSVGAVEAPWNEAADRLYLTALADRRALAALEPDDVDLQFQIAGLLEELGDYPAAKAVLDQILLRWPEHAFRVTIRVAALDRRQGHVERALEQLDDYAAHSFSVHGLGMRFHYHRGWTLLRLGRFEDAVKDFDLGLEAQPDYAYARLRRGCALAGLGRLNGALADFEHATAQLNDIPEAGASWVRSDLRRLRTVIAQLRKLRSTRPNQPVPGTCEGYWGHPDESRRRSPLLPAA